MTSLVAYVRSLAVASIVALASVPAPAASLAGVELPDQAEVGGKTVVLNGLGLRTATIFKVKVYVIGLYLEEKSSDPKAIIGSRGAKRITMHFVHDVTADELRGGWSESFEANYADAGSIKSEIAQFNASMRDVKSGDTMVLDLSGDTVEVRIRDQLIDKVSGAAFQEAVLSIWLGSKPPNPELKTGLLGG